MNSEPPDDRVRQRSPWKTFVGTFLVVVTPVFTVFGAVLLSVQGQAPSSQPITRQPEHTPTAIPDVATVTLAPASAATLQATSAGPTIPSAGQTEAPNEADLSLRIEVVRPTSEHADKQKETPTSTSTSEPRDDGRKTPSPPPATEPPPTATPTATPEPTPTPWPCAGGAPMDWQLYVVQRGDTLFSLARKHGTTIYYAVYYNCLTSYGLWVGQSLYLPEPLAPSPDAPTLTPTPEPSATP